MGVEQGGLGYKTTGQEDSKQDEFKKELQSFNDQLKDFDGVSAKKRKGEVLTEEDEKILSNTDFKDLDSKRSQFVRENYKQHELVSVSNEDSNTYKHIDSHLSGGFGSNFTKSEIFQNPKSVISFAEKILEKAYKGELDKANLENSNLLSSLKITEGKEGGRVVIEVIFNSPIGVNALVERDESMQTLPVENSDLLPEVKARYAGTEAVSNLQKEQTNKMYIIGGSFGPTGKFGLYTTYPGEYAPRVPNPTSTPEELEFWKKHVFIVNDGEKE